MDVIQVLIVMAVIGVVCWALVAFVPMPEPFRKFIIGVGVLLTLLWLVHHIAGFRMP
jgi:hypothetical protein